MPTVIRNTPKREALERCRRKLDFAAIFGFCDQQASDERADNWR